MNQTIDLLKEHRTYRHFQTDYPLPTEDLQAILDASRQAASWMNGQMYSIIVIQDTAIRQQMVAWNPGNPQILESSVFLLFLADLKRTAKVAEAKHAPYLVAEGLNPLLIATTDASLALQNAVIAAESLGLGTCIVGSVRNQLTEISELLDLPDYVLPLAGLAIGKPNVAMRIKPRLPEKAVIHYDRYQAYPAELLEEYDETMVAFAEKRETKRWTQKFADFFSQRPNPAIDAYLKYQKLIK